MKTELKIVADHLRSSCFLIADGVLPSNEGRGYVLRRIMRRAMRQLHKLGTKKASMFQFVDSLIKEMGEAFPELSRARATIIETLKNEEEKFRETLEKGLKILEEELSNVQNNKFSGKTAFKLYDTYGFPLDLTQDILKEKNIEVDIETFNQEMKEQRQRAKANWKGSGEELENREILELQEALEATKFLGYEQSENEATILQIIVNGKKTNFVDENSAGKNITIILDQTCFYATSGGQRGDEGVLQGKNSENKITIFETTKTGSLFLHQGKKISGKFEINDKIIAKIDKNNRKNCAKNHSATHLMHKALKLILGDSISQKGSNVQSKSFTFDFNFNRATTAEELTKIENLVNFYITQNYDTKTEIMPLEKAREQGAEALFGEKYEDEVRVISLGQTEEKTPYSIELCGGTHVKNTKEIEFFKIISEKSIASGIRRIEAKTGEDAKEFILTQLANLHQEISQKEERISQLKNEISNLSFSATRSGDVTLTSEIKGSTFSNEEKIQNFDSSQVEKEIKNLAKKSLEKDEEIKNLNKELQKIKKQELLSNLDNFSSEKINEITIAHQIFENIDAKDLREALISLKSQSQYQNSHIFLFFSKNQDKISALVAISENLLAKFNANNLIKEVVAKIGGKGGGGKPDLAMGGGNNENGINDAIEFVKNEIK